MELSDEILGSLSEEMRERVAACETPEELAELATSEGDDLTEEQLKMLSGGDGWMESIASGVNGCGANC